MSTRAPLVFRAWLVPSYMHPCTAPRDPNNHLFFLPIIRCSCWGSTHSSPVWAHTRLAFHGGTHICLEQQAIVAPLGGSHTAVSPSAG